MIAKVFDGRAYMREKLDKEGFNLLIRLVGLAMMEDKKVDHANTEEMKKLYARTKNPTKADVDRAMEMLNEFVQTKTQEFVNKA